MAPAKSAEAPRVIVVGAGIAGLGAARRLVGRGVDVRVLERAGRPGGRATTEFAEGFALEAASPLVSSADRELLAWIDEVGVRDALLPLRPVVTVQVHRDRMTEIDPRGLRGIAKIPGLRRLHWLRLLRLPRLMKRYRPRLDIEEPGRAAPLDDRSLADFGRLYFGRSVVDHWMAPFVSAGLLADARETSRALFVRRLHSHGEARWGLPRATLGELTEAAAARLPVLYGADVDLVTEDQGGKLRVDYRMGERERAIECDAVIVATDAGTAARIAAPLVNRAERDNLAAVCYAPSIALGVALRRPFELHPCCVCVPASEESPLDSVLLEPGVAGGRVPDGRGLATLRASGEWSRQAFELPAESIEKDLLDAFERFRPGARNAVLFTRLFRTPRAQPRFDVGRYRAIARFEQVHAGLCAEGRRLYFAGDYLLEPSWNGALLSGHRAARAAAADLAAVARVR